MNLKLGDFGLATMAHDEEKMKYERLHFTHSHTDEHYSDHSVALHIIWLLKYCVMEATVLRWTCGPLV